MLHGLSLDQPAHFSTDSTIRNALWHLRKGLYASVAGARPPGTTALLEDIVVPVPALGRTCEQLVELFDRYSFEDSVIFGHAKDGNIHFMLTDGFASTNELDRYNAFTEDMVDLVLGEGGSLKAEHGTGRVMAPYVRRQYGDELYDVMRRIKELCDPAGVLNPGVILNDDPKAHLRHIKVDPPVEEEVDRCVSCGYCEPVCPSRDLTLTPRQRIVTLRAIETARQAGDEKLVRELERDYDYESVQTCAVDGMCQTACPVNINTGDLVRRLRREKTGKVAAIGWDFAARHWGSMTKIAALGLTAADKLPSSAIVPANRGARAVLGNDTVPLYSAELPTGGRRRSRHVSAREPIAVYFPTCTSAMFGAAESASPHGGIQDSFLMLVEKAGLEMLIPDDIDGLCCGTPWSSKGMVAGHETMRNRTMASLRKATQNGRLPIVCDASSCTEGLRQAVETAETKSGEAPLRIVDVVEYAAEHILPRLPEGTRLPSLALHPTCSSTRMGINEDLSVVAAAVAEKVEVPTDWGCCAFAGDRGMLHPELTGSATARQAEQVAEMGAAARLVQSDRELGMSRATVHQYRHILELLNDITPELRQKYPGDTKS